MDARGVMAKASWRDVRSEASVQRHYQVAKARSRALVRLAKRHPEEFAALFTAEKAARGVTPSRSTGVQSTGRCERCDLRIDRGRLCEFCEEWDA